MYNWSTDIKKLKQNSEKYARWKLEQLINYGLNGQRISKKELLRYWDQLVLDPKRKRFLELLLKK